jgi:hypothetical protein
MQTGDFWGPIFKNLHEDGGWLTLEEIFSTGFEHRFVPKPPTETESWARFVEVEEEEDNEPAMMLFREVSRVYRDGQPDIDLPPNQLFDFRRIRVLAQKQHEIDEVEDDQYNHFDLRLSHQLTLEKEPEELQPVAEVDNWDAEIANAWTNFSEILRKSGLQQRIEIEAFVRNRRAQWVAMDQEKRNQYQQWKLEHFVQQKDPDQIKLRDLMMSMQCLEIPHSHYACTICWHSLTVRKENSTDGMRKHCYHAHNLPAYRCHDTITLTLRSMVGQDVMLAAEIDNQGTLEKVIVRGNYQQCYHLNCQHKSTNGVGMLGHLETDHKKRNPPCMGVWDILLEHLEHNPDATLADLIGSHEAIVCKHPGCGHVATTEKAMLAHNSQQHRSEAQWARAPLKIHLGIAAPQATTIDPIKEYVDLSEQFFGKRNMTQDEAGAAGRKFKEMALKDWSIGVKEKHPTRSEASQNLPTPSNPMPQNKLSH